MAGNQKLDYRRDVSDEASIDRETGCLILGVGMKLRTRTMEKGEPDDDGIPCMEMTTLLIAAVVGLIRSGWASG